MKLIRCIFLSVAAVVSWSNTALGDNLLIDFETFSDGADLVAPVGFGNATALRDIFLTQGVRFEGANSLDGGALLDDASNLGASARSGNNFIAFDNTSGSLSDGGSAMGTLEIIFSNPVTNFSIFGFGGSAGVPISITGHNQFGNVLWINQAAIPVGQYGEVAPHPDSTDTPTDFVRISYGASTRWFLDDLSFTTIPEPATFTILALGSMVLLGRKVA